MTIKEVCEKYDITPDTLRYYERVGVIPTVTRTKGGIRDYEEEDIKWVQNAICMRNAGLPVEKLIEYVRLFQEGDSTIQARRDLLAEAMRRLWHYPIVGHVHDEVIVETEDVETVCRLMEQEADWLPGLKLRADGYTCRTYRKE